MTACGKKSTEHAAKGPLCSGFVTGHDFSRGDKANGANGAFAPAGNKRRNSHQIWHLSASPQSGFTLIELMVVMLIIGVLMTLAVPRYTSAIKNAREAVLKEDLHVIRNAIDSYTMDKQKAPQSLQDLVESGYLKVIPVDPMTRSADTWVADQSDSLHSVDQTDPGVDDVHSGSQETGSDGQPYNTW